NQPARELDHVLCAFFHGKLCAADAKRGRQLCGHLGVFYLVSESDRVRMHKARLWMAGKAILPRGTSYQEPDLNDRLGFFWHESIHDGMYEPAINPVRSGRTSRARYIGSQATVQAE